MIVCVVSVCACVSCASVCTASECALYFLRNVVCIGWLMVPLVTGNQDVVLGGTS